MKVLVVTHYVPMPDRQADMRRLVEILQLAASDHSISLLATDVPGQRLLYGEECVSTAASRLKALRVALCTESEAVAAAADYDVVLFEHYLLARSRMERMRYRFPRAVVVIDTVDIAYLRWASKDHASAGNVSLSAEVQAIKSVELDSYASADLVVAISEAERRHLRGDLPNQRLHVIPLILDVPPLQPKRPRTGNILFVGNFTYAANVDAVRWLVDEIFPLVRRAIPAAHLTIVGNKPPPDVVTDPSRGIDVTGFVPDLAPYYETCDVSVAPLTWGGGLKGKVAEAMAFGLPVVTTSIGALGFDLEHRRHAMVADSPAEFAAAVVELLDDCTLNEHVRSEGRSLVESNYSRARVNDAVAGLFALAEDVSPARLSLRRRLRMALKITFHRHVGWRLDRATNRGRVATE